MIQLLFPRHNHQLEPQWKILQKSQTALLCVDKSFLLEKDNQTLKDWLLATVYSFEPDLPIPVMQMRGSAAPGAAIVLEKENMKERGKKIHGAFVGKLKIACLRWQ